jgi:TPR repeat protein
MHIIVSSAAARKLFVVATLILVGTGCQRALEAESPYDHQSCVETSLRRNAKGLGTDVAPTRFEASCRSGDMGACSALGLLHEMGVGVRADAKSAAKYYLLACEGGNTRACLNLGDLLVKNEGEGHDPVSASLIFRDQCERGAQDACTRLGSLYLVGDGLPLQPITAERLFTGACASGRSEACVRLAELASSRNDVQLADRMYGRACVSGDLDACGRLRTRESAAELRTSMLAPKDERQSATR